MMRWRKLGRIYAPSGRLAWARQYALLPTPEVIDEHTIRIYFAALDDEQRGRIGFVEVDASDPARIRRETTEPILEPGPPGQFDDSGVNPSCIVDAGGRRLLYYIGWQRCLRVPYMLFTGLASSEDGGTTFRKVSRTPVLDRTDAEPFSRSAPFVMRDGDRWRMWYWSCVRWSDEGRGIHYNNAIRHLTSDDGLNWHGVGATCLEPEFADEYSLGRPWVVRDGPTYKMWYSIRSVTRLYEIGYAESRDGVLWERMDDRTGLARSQDGWDSEMICYPSIVDAAGRRYLFYNGNQHGATGFGHAVLES